MSTDYYMRFILKEANPKQKLLLMVYLRIKVPHYHIIHLRSNRRMRNFISTYRNRENYIKSRSVNAINPDNYHETIITSIPLIKFGKIIQYFYNCLIKVVYLLKSLTIFFTNLLFQVTFLKKYIFTFNICFLIKFCNIIKDISFFIFLYNLI